MTITFHRKRLIKTAIAMYSLLGVFFILTSPSNLPILMLIAPVVWLFIALSITFYLLLGWSKLGVGEKDRRDAIYGMSGAGVICSVLLLRSVNQLNGRDILLVSIFAVIAGFYVRKLRQQTS